MSALTSVSGFPRIGQNRELKKIIEAYWKGNTTLDEMRSTAKELRANFGLDFPAFVQKMERSTKLGLARREAIRGR